jgi:two-component sensor histidine kinase
MPFPYAASTDALTAELDAADAARIGNDALLAAVLAGSGDCIKILDLDGRLQFMSEGGKHVMEIDDFSAIKGCPWPDFWAGEGHSAARQAIADARDGRHARFLGSANTGRGNSKYWDVRVMPIRGADGAPTHLLSISTDITEQRNAETRQQELAGELQHRIKNTLAMVGAIATQTLRGDDIAERRNAFVARLQALGQAHDLLTDNTWQSAPIRGVIERALLPHVSGSNDFAIEGPAVELSAKQALSLSLAVHELATNAVKYGALSLPGGGVSIDWSLQSNGHGNPAFCLKWEERSGPVVARPDRLGFGSRLVTRVLAADFDGEVSIDYAPSGVVWILTSPLVGVADDEAAPAQR